MKHNMRLLILSTNKQRDENIFPVIEVLSEKYGMICDYIETNDFHAKMKPPFINDLLKVESVVAGKKISLDSIDNSYKRRLRNLWLLKKFLTKRFLERYDALLIGGDDYFGRYLLKKFRGKPRFLVQDGLFFNITSRLIYKEIIKGNKKTTTSFLFFFKYLAKESMIKVFNFLDVSYLFFSYSGKSEFDLFFISGTYTKDLLNNQGVSDDRLFVSGMPRFKYLFEDSSGKNNKLPPFNKTKHAISFMTGAYKNHSMYEMDVCEKKFLKELCRRMEKFATSVQLYIKVHPRDAVSDFDQYAKHDFVTIISDVPVKRVLLESDIILANASTTTVEAAFMSTPVIITLVSFVQTFKFSSYYSNNRDYNCVAETWEELEKYMVNILNNETYRNEVVRKQLNLTEALICSETVNSDIAIADEIHRRVAKC